MDQPTKQPQGTFASTGLRSTPPFAKSNVASVVHLRQTSSICFVGDAIPDAFRPATMIVKGVEAAARIAQSLYGFEMSRQVSLTQSAQTVRRVLRRDDRQCRCRSHDGGGLDGPADNVGD